MASLDKKAFQCELRYGPFGPTVIVWRQDDAKKNREEYRFNFDAAKHTFILYSYERLGRNKQGHWAVSDNWRRSYSERDPCTLKMSQVPKHSSIKTLVMEKFISSLQFDPFRDMVERVGTNSNNGNGKRKTNASKSVPSKKADTKKQSSVRKR